MPALGFIVRFILTIGLGLTPAAAVVGMATEGLLPRAAVPGLLLWISLTSAVAVYFITETRRTPQREGSAA